MSTLNKALDQGALIEVKDKNNVIGYQPNQVQNNSTALEQENKTLKQVNQTLSNDIATLKTQNEALIKENTELKKQLEQPNNNTPPVQNK